MDNFKMIVVTLVWTFTVLLTYMITNTMVFGYITPTMTDIAYQSRDNVTGGFVDYEGYISKAVMIKSGFNIACFILVLIPYAYLFVRLLLKKEQTTAPIYYPGGGGGW